MWMVPAHYTALLSNFKHDCRHPYAPAGLDLFAAMSISGALYCKHIISRLPEGLTSCLTRHMVWQNEGLSLRGGVLLIELLLRSLGTRLPGCPVPRLCVGVTNVVSCSLGTRRQVSGPQAKGVGVTNVLGPDWRYKLTICQVPRLT